MARAKRTQKKKYKFELTLGAIGGVGVVCFCIFLWMFLLGVWTGQSLLMPSTFEAGGGKNVSTEQVVHLQDQKKHKPQQ